MRDRLLAAEKVKAIDWRDDALYLLDQRALPSRESWVACSSVEAVAAAIRTMVVRGAPAIGISAAYGLVLSARERIAEGGDFIGVLPRRLQPLGGLCTDGGDVEQHQQDRKSTRLNSSHKDTSRMPSSA